MSNQESLVITNFVFVFFIVIYNYPHPPRKEMIKHDKKKEKKNNNYDTFINHSPTFVECCGANQSMDDFRTTSESLVKSLSVTQITSQQLRTVKMPSNIEKIKNVATAKFVSRFRLWRGQSPSLQRQSPQ